MSNNYLFQPKSNGAVSFRQQSLKMNDENLAKVSNGNKSIMGIQEESQREFGKDITNLTIHNQENVNPNARKSLDGNGKGPGGMNNGVYQKKGGKEDLTTKLKNYNLRGRALTSKTVNEVIQQSKKEKESNATNANAKTTNSSITTVTIPTSSLNMNLSNMSNVIINNEIMESGMNANTTETGANTQDVDMMMTDEIVFNPVNAKSTDKSPPEVFNPRPQLCEEYIPEIFEHLKEIEFDHLPTPTYMKQQTDINEKMRSILVDWLVEVHLKFKLLPETLFLTVNLIDRYLELKHIMRNKLQLVGVTAMLIACKYEEIYAPEVRDFVYITDKAYTKDEILNMENDMLATLQYNITVPSPMRYLEIYNFYLKLDDSAMMFCRYLLELFLVEYKMLKYNPSLLASSTLYITLKITKKCEYDRVYELTGYNEDKLRDCAKDICLILDNVEKNSLQAIKKKFSMPKFLEVAKIKFN